MSCECARWDLFRGTGVMIYQPTCILQGHAERAREQQALRDAADDLGQLRNKWRRASWARGMGW